MVDFLVIGNGGSVICKDIFPLIKDRIVRLGVTLFCGKMPTFTYIDGSETTVNSCAWFTTLKNNKVNKFIDLKKFDESRYSKFDNYNGINVDRTSDIPDYDGVMGVPITFLEKWNPEQFDIVGFRKGDDGKDLFVDGKYVYVRILIKRKLT